MDLSETEIVRQAGPADALPGIRKVVVAIHGIGSQQRSDTIRAVARCFGDRKPPLPVMPLGYFQGSDKKIHLSRLLTTSGDLRPTTRTHGSGKNAFQRRCGVGLRTPNQYISSVETEVDEFNELISGAAVARAVGLRVSIIAKSFTVSEASLGSRIELAMIGMYCVARICSRLMSPILTVTHCVGCCQLHLMADGVEVGGLVFGQSRNHDVEPVLITARSDVGKTKA
jgi:hypothetical protein